MPPSGWGLPTPSAGRTADPVARVRELTGGEGVDVAFEALGRPETFQQAVAMVRDGGTMVAVGIADGPAAAEIGITHMVRRSIRLVGSYGGRTRTDMPALLGLAQTGAVNVDAQISTRVPLDEADRSTRPSTAARSSDAHWSCRDPAPARTASTGGGPAR